MGKNHSGGCTVGAGCTDWVGLSRPRLAPTDTKRRHRKHDKVHWDWILEGGSRVFMDIQRHNHQMQMCLSWCKLRLKGWEAREESKPRHQSTEGAASPQCRHWRHPRWSHGFASLASLASLPSLAVLAFPIAHAPDPPSQR